MISALTVFHLAKTAGRTLPVEGWDRCLPPAGTTRIWCLDTCQRWLLVVLRSGAGATRDPGPLPTGMEAFYGAEAYAFLLQVATGLASRLTGETNILGQMKAAWGQHAVDVAWLQWLFADAKEIRTRFLCGVGNASYGSLVRHLLRQGSGPAGGAVLVVGAGDMAATVAPWLRTWPLQLLNRTSARAEKLAETLRAQPGEPVSVVPQDLAEVAWRAAGAVVVCVPADAGADRERLHWLAGSLHAQLIPVIHLGVHRHQAQIWGRLPQLLCLDDLYSLQARANEQRRRQLLLAFEACMERARHRALGTSLSHPHGWEDLPSFRSRGAHHFENPDNDLGPEIPGNPLAADRQVAPPALGEWGIPVRREPVADFNVPAV